MKSQDIMRALKDSADKTASKIKNLSLSRHSRQLQNQGGVNSMFPAGEANDGIAVNQSIDNCYSSSNMPLKIHNNDSESNFQNLQNRKKANEVVSTNFIR